MHTKFSWSLILLILISFSCKKGDQDPAFSLLSRKARLSGTYEISNFYCAYQHTSYNGGSPYSENRTLQFEASEGSDLVNATLRDLVVNSSSFVIKKDGTWSMELNTTSTWIEENAWPWDYAIQTENATLTQTGYWSFMDESGGYQNKERVLFEYTSSDQTIVLTTQNNSGGSADTFTNTTINNSDYSGGTFGVIYAIEKLKNKEIIMTRTGATGLSSINPEEWWDQGTSSTSTDSLSITLSK